MTEALWKLAAYATTSNVSLFFISIPLTLRWAWKEMFFYLITQAEKREWWRWAYGYNRGKQDWGWGAKMLLLIATMKARSWLLLMWNRMEGGRGEFCFEVGFWATEENSYQQHQHKCYCSWDKDGVGCGYIITGHNTGQYRHPGKLLSQPVRRLCSCRKISKYPKIHNCN